MDLFVVLISQIRRLTRSGPLPSPLIHNEKIVANCGTSPSPTDDCPLHVAQSGSKHPDAKQLKGFKGAGVLEVVDDYNGDTYRAVYCERALKDDELKWMIELREALNLL